jgi:4-amino-4-deoxy-L-arabinose transferase-like glycosyltransferase
VDQLRRLVLLAPVAVAAALFLPGIGERILYIGDEARYALLARNMVETGDWLVPRIGGEVHMEKSPLFIWTIAVLSLGRRDVTELTAVLPAALSGIGGVGATLLLGRRLFGPRAGLLAAFVLATTWGYFWHARLALADMMVTFFIVGGAVGFWAAAGSGEGRRLPMAVCWACLGLGFSAKGPAGLMPVLPFAAFLISEDGWRGLRKLRPLMGVAIVALISAPWALAFALQGEESYVKRVLLEDYLGPRLRPWDRFSELFFVFGPIGVGFLPWTPFLPAAVRNGWWRAEDAEVRRKFRFLAFWVLAYAVVITLMPHKRDRYLLPVHPALALMVGWLWDRWAARPVAGALRVHGWVWGGLVAAMAVAVLLPLRVRPELAVLIPPTLLQKLLLVGLLLAAAVVAVVAARSGRPLAMFAALCVPMVLVLAYETKVFVPAHNRMYDVKSFSRRVAARLGPEAQLVTYRWGPLSLQFYTRRTVQRVQDPAELERLLSAERPLYVVADERAWRTLPEATGRLWSFSDRATLGGRQVLVGSPVERP